jgi:hypothetical protein
LLLAGGGGVLDKDPGGDVNADDADLLLGLDAPAKVPKKNSTDNDDDLLGLLGDDLATPQRVAPLLGDDLLGPAGGSVEEEVLLPDIEDDL